jgi:hypothetical protein
MALAEIERMGRWSDGRPRMLPLGRVVCARHGRFVGEVFRTEQGLVYVGRGARHAVYVEDGTRTDGAIDVVALGSAETVPLWCSRCGRTRNVAASSLASPVGARRHADTPVEIRV